MDSDTDDFQKKTNESLNTPCGKKPQLIKIIENRKLPSATFPLVPGTIVTGTKFLPTEKNLGAKFIQKPVTTMTLTPSTSSSSVSSVPIVINTKPKLMPSSSVYKISGKIESAAGPSVASVGAGSGSILSKTGAASLTTIDGKTAVKTPSGKIIFIQKAPAGGLTKSSTTTTTLANSPTGILAAARLQQSLTTSTSSTMTTVSTPKASAIIAAAGAKVPLKPISSTSGLNVTTSKKPPTSSVSESPKFKPINKQSNVVTRTTASTSTTTTTTVANLSAGGITMAKQTVNGTNVKSCPLLSSATSSAVITSKPTSPKPVQIKIVRTSDGKLIKLNPPAICTGELAASVARGKTSAESLASQSATTSSGQVIVKSLKKVPSESLAKNFNIRAASASSSSIAIARPTIATTASATVKSTTAATAVKTTIPAAAVKSTTAAEAVKATSAPAVVKTTTATSIAKGTTIISSKPILTTNNAGNATTIRKFIPMPTVHPSGAVKTSNLQTSQGTSSTKLIQHTTTNKGSAMEIKTAVKSASQTLSPPSQQSVQVTRITTATSDSGSINSGTKLLNRMVPSTSSSVSSVSTSTVASASGSTANKAVVHNTSGGKPIVLSNQQLVKAAPKTPVEPTTTISAVVSTAASSSHPAKVVGTQLGGKLQAIQMPGKGGGVRYVRLLPKGSTIPGKTTLVSPSTAQKTVDIVKSAPDGNVLSKSNNNSSVVTTTNSGGGTTAAKASAVTTTILNSTLMTPPLTSTATSTSTSTPTSSTSVSEVKVLNSVPQKFTIVRSNKGHTKFVLKQSPTPDGLHSMSQKKLVSSLKSLSTSADGIASTSAEAAARAARKHKISDINMEIKRITSSSGDHKNEVINDETTEASEAKKARYVVMRGPSMQYKKIVGGGGGQIKTVTRTSTGAPTSSYTLHRLTGTQGVCKQSPNILNSSIQSSEKSTTTPITNSSGASFPTSAQSKQLYNILNAHSNKSSNVRSYVVCNAATGEKSITVRRPFYSSMYEMKASKSRKGLISASHLERVARLNKNTVSNAIRTEGVPVKFSNKALFDKMKNPLATNNLSTISSQLVKSGKPSTTTTTAAATPSSISHTVVEMATAPAPSTSAAAAIGMADASGVAGIDATALTSRRKHCNCSKSQCLKLYCDCFANGEFCQDCTCKDCCNNLQYEDERQQAIKTCLERNPSAFKPKITARKHSDMRLHNKGCNCKRSGCLKNYCECYEAKIPCSGICKCVGCRNMEDRPDVDLDYLESKKHSTAGTSYLSEKRLQKSSLNEGGDEDDVTIVGDTSATRKSPASFANTFITDDVIDATILCMISQLAECEKEDIPDEEIETRVMEELGRCVSEIIDFTGRNESNQLDESISS